MQVVIVEDEKPAARKLQKLLEMQGVLVSQLLHSVAEARAWFTNCKKPNVIFLDIQLSDGLSFEIFENLNIDVPVVFTTAYDAYAIKAFELNSIDYLLKPITADNLKRAIQKYRQHYQQQSIDIQAVQALFMQHMNAKNLRFTSKIGMKLKVFELSEIQAFVSEHKITYLITKTGKQYPIEKSLEETEQLLSKHEFFRINRSCIVHFSAIEEILNYSNSRLKLQLKNASSLATQIVSRERVKEFKQWL
ncbi:MAG: LytTR family DNA-binding domain-containing protein, partial [Flavobacteriaceae bacterium]|nr:LytTR family DNA-binding domain-containing protein [Flavobacteriaceae bacterium]